MAQNKRFSRNTFPKDRPINRRSFSWGTVSFFSSPEPRVAIVVSKKTLKKAHDRNRAKRRVRAMLPTLSRGTIIHLRKEALTTPADVLKQDLEQATQNGFGS